MQEFVIWFGVDSIVSLNVKSRVWVRMSQVWVKLITLATAEEEYHTPMIINVWMFFWRLIKKDTVTRLNIYLLLILTGHVASPAVSAGTRHITLYTCTEKSFFLCTTRTMPTHSVQKLPLNLSTVYKLWCKSYVQIILPPFYLSHYQCFKGLYACRYSETGHRSKGIQGPYFCRKCDHFPYFTSMTYLRGLPVFPHVGSLGSESAASAAYHGPCRLLAPGCHS